ncbi:metal-dependent hydrolase [Euryarchaeota archaeon ex4484_178]|nr:MAG: metal-dependent hydrolase [Euryarchaeota archaeon ex4484_178]
MKVTWLGHSAFIIEEGGKKVLVDPFITGNEKAPVKPDDIECDLIAVTHGHGDHLGDAIFIGKRKNVPIVAIYELAQYISSKGANGVGMNFGGTYEYEGIKLSMVPALHSSGITESNFAHDGGLPAGFVIEINGKKVYHAGDTGLFGDMRLIGELYRPDVALLPVGGLFTMDTKLATIAAKWIKPKFVIPMHYNTWPPIEANPEEMREELKKEGIELIVLKPGESFEF